MSAVPVGVRYRRTLREIRTAPMPVPVLALTVIFLLIADLVGLGTVSGDDRVSRQGALHAGGGSGSTSSAGPGSNSSSVSGLDSGAGGSAAGGGGSNGSALSGGGPGGTGGVTGNGIASGGSGGSVGGGAAGGGGGGSGGVSGGLGSTDRGVTPTSVRVVFPWPDLGPVGQATGLNTSSEDAVMSINTYVNDINSHGGILGRKISPEIVSFNPLDASDMRSKCKTWTQDEKVFAVVDSGAWHDDQQLCITQEGHTPLISPWTTVSEWTQRGNPYLWWTGPDDAAVVRNLAAWGKSRGLLKPGAKFGVVGSDREGDNLALNEYFLPALRRAGLTPATVDTLHFDASDGATASSQAPLVIQRQRSAGVTTVIPLLPFLTLSSYVNTAQAQGFFPRYLLSDYESTLTVALGLADGNNAKSLQDMTGPSSFVLGNSDDPRGYTPQALDCYNVWQRANPGVTPPPHHYVESTGTAMTWCQNIRLFATAARAAGPGLTRDTFDQAMSQQANFPGTVIPNLSFSATNRAGPHLARTVQVHENGDGHCPLKADGQAQGSCWLVLDDFRPLQSP